MFDEPEDMFAETGSAPAPAPAPAAMPRQAAPATMPAAAAPVAPASYEAASGGGFPVKGVIVALAVVLVIAAAAGLSFLLLSARTPSTPGVPDVSSAVSEDTGVPVAPASETVPVPPPSSQPPTPPAPIITPPASPEPDQDMDGLTDAQEAQLGTSPVEADSDADGLFDREEVETYRTNPLNPDTDADGFPDGSEVRNGYNPNGEGRLLPTPGAS